MISELVFFDCRRLDGTQIVVLMPIGHVHSEMLDVTTTNKQRFVCFNRQVDRIMMPLVGGGVAARA